MLRKPKNAIYKLLVLSLLFILVFSALHTQFISANRIYIRFLMKFNAQNTQKLALFN
jgi:hypothetical protein